LFATTFSGLPAAWSKPLLHFTALAGKTGVALTLREVAVGLAVAVAVALAVGDGLGVRVRVGVRVAGDGVAVTTMTRGAGGGCGCGGFTASRLGVECRRLGDLGCKLAILLMLY